MANTFTTEYFENATLYTEKHAFEWLPEHDERPAMHIGFNINDPFFKPLGAEITSLFLSMSLSTATARKIGII